MSTAWAIDPIKARALRSFAFRALDGQAISDDERASNRVGQGREGAAPAPQAGVAVVPIVGTIVHRAEQADDVSAPGAVSAARLRSTMAALANDDSVSAVVLDIESPGGSVDGIKELASSVARLAEVKPVTAVANAYAASAAYWIASQASEIVVTPSGEVGSIGVYTLHEDDTAMLESMGVKLEVIRAEGADKKIAANPFEPLTEEARADLKQSVTACYDEFIQAVARGRGISAATLRKSPYGKGLMVSAKEAVRVGLADRIETIEETVARLAKGRGRTRAQRRKTSMARAKLAFA
jgi:signal peptide peptidase SppA